MGRKLLFSEIHCNGMDPHLYFNQVVLTGYSFELRSKPEMKVFIPFQSLSMASVKYCFGKQSGSILLPWETFQRNPLQNFKALDFIGHSTPFSILFHFFFRNVYLILTNAKIVEYIYHGSKFSKIGKQKEKASTEMSTYYMVNTFILLFWVVGHLSYYSTLFTYILQKEWGSINFI